MLNITNARYIANQVTGENWIIKADISGIEHCVPLDPANTEYAEIMRQVEAGELTIAPADEEE